MTTQPDFEELLGFLEENNVRYMIVGGYAVAFHGHPRFTKDIDIFYARTPENIDKLRKSLLEFDFSESEIPHNLFEKTGNIIQFGVAPVQIDLLNEIDGVTFEEAENYQIRGRYGAHEVNFIGREDLIRNKKASGRTQDKADVEHLE